MTKNELIDGLLDWADGDNLSVIIVAGDDGGRPRGLQRGRQ